MVRPHPPDGRGMGGGVWSEGTSLPPPGGGHETRFSVPFIASRNFDISSLTCIPALCVPRQLRGRDPAGRLPVHPQLLPAEAAALAGVGGSSGFVCFFFVRKVHLPEADALAGMGKMLLHHRGGPGLGVGKQTA